MSALAGQLPAARRSVEVITSLGLEIHYNGWVAADVHLVASLGDAKAT